MRNGGKKEATRKSRFDARRPNNSWIKGEKEKRRGDYYADSLFLSFHHQCQTRVVFLNSFLFATCVWGCFMAMCAIIENRASSCCLLWTENIQALAAHVHYQLQTVGKDMIAWKEFSSNPFLQDNIEVGLAYTQYYISQYSKDTMAEILLHSGLDIASKSLSRIEVQTRPVSVHRKPAENKPLRSCGPTLFGGMYLFEPLTSTICILSHNTNCWGLIMTNPCDKIPALQSKYISNTVN